MGMFPVLNQNKEFRTLYYHGKSKVHPLLVTYVRKNRLGITRVGITTGKKIGKAVQRNRCRRIVRESFRLLKPYLKEGYDVVFVCRSKTADAKMTDLKSVMENHFKELGIWSVSK